MRKFHLLLLIVIIAILIASKMYDVSFSDTKGLSFTNLIIYPALLLLILANLGRLSTIQYLPAFWPLVFILILAAASLFYARFMAYGIKLDLFTMLASYKNHIFEPFLMYAAGFMIAKYSSEKPTTLYIYTIAFAVLNIIAISVFVTGINPFGVSVISHGETRFASFGGMANQGAYSLLLLIPLFYYLYEKSSGKLARSSYLIFIFTSLAAIGLTGSRGGYLLLIVVFMLMMHVTKRYRFFISIGTIGIVVLISYAATFNMDFLINAASRFDIAGGQEKITDFQKKEGFSTIDQISAGRTWIWKGIYEVMKEDPLALVLGKGWNTYRPHVQNVLGIAPAAHNVFLLYLFQLGVVGLSMFCIAGYQYLQFIRKQLHHKDRLLSQCIQIMILVVIWAFMLAAPVNLYKIWGLLFGLLAGYVVAMQAKPGLNNHTEKSAITNARLPDSDGIFRRRKHPKNINRR